jgi:hypothetical protein
LSVAMMLLISTAGSPRNENSRGKPGRGRHGGAAFHLPS